MDTFLDACSCLRGPISFLLKCCSCCNRRKHEIKSKDIYAEFQVSQLNNMLEKAHDDLDDFVKSVQSIQSDGWNNADISFKDKRF